MTKKTITKLKKNIADAGGITKAAEKSGISRQQLYNYMERGAKPRADRIVAGLKKLGLTREEVIA